MSGNGDGRRRSSGIGCSRADELPEGRVTTVHAGLQRAARSSTTTASWAALDNRCPHQGGPLGEGSIENGLLRCPWHGFDYDPLTGGLPRRLRRRRRPASRSRSARTASTSASSAAGRARAHGLGRDGRDDGQLGRPPRLRHGRATRTSGLADAIRRQEQAGNLTLHRDPPRGRGGVRRLGLRQAHRQAGRLPDDRRARSHQPADRASGTPRSTASPVLALTGQVEEQVLGPGAFQEVDLAAAFASVAGWSQTVLPSSKHAELMSLAREERRRAPRRRPT